MIRHSKFVGAYPFRRTGRPGAGICVDADQAAMDALNEPPPEPRKHAAGDLRTAPIVDLAIRVGALGLLLYLALVLIWPFITVVIWSVVIAVALDPAYERLAHWLGRRRRLAAALITVVSLLVVIGPVTWLALGLIDS